MLQRDYIQRLIREFMAALQRFLEKKEVGERRQALEDLYKEYFGDYAFFHTSTLDELMDFFSQYPEAERLDRMEMLAELYYAEADLLSEPLRTSQLELTYSLFDFIDRHSSTFSISRMEKKRIIKDRESLDLA